MKTLSALIGFIAMLLSPAAFAADESRVALELLLVAVTLAAMLVITWRRRYIALAKRRVRSKKNDRI